MNSSPPIPRFYLYGESPREVDAQFLHIETIDERSQPSQGRIKPHLHTGLAHIFLFEAGHGIIEVDGEAMDFSGPHLLIMPPGPVHGFHFQPDVRGYVLTLASAYLRDLVQTRLNLGPPRIRAELLAIDHHHHLHDIRVWLLRLRRELVWAAPGQRAAIEANLIGLLVEVYRLSLDQRGADTLPGHIELMARFHELIEAHYREPLGLTGYLHRLRATEAQLRYACEKAGEAAPMQLVLNRRYTEAKRLLIYSDLSIGECAASLGFEDQAYFTRLFSRMAGQSPKSYRRAHRSDA